MAKIKTNIKQESRPSNELFAGLGLIALIIGSLYLAFDPDYRGAGQAGNASAADYAYDPSGWYLYQTKENEFFHVKYPNDWVRAYGGGFEGEEYFEARTPSAGIILKVWARTNKKHPDLDSFISEIDAVNKTKPNFHILKERRITADGQPAIQREEYVTGRQHYSIVTYVFGGNVIVEFYTDFPEAKKISSYYVTLHNALLGTFGFTY